MHHRDMYHTECLVCSSKRLAPLPKFQRVELVRCSDCGLVFSPRIPTTEELVAHYEGYTRDTTFDSAISVQRREEWLDGFEAFRRTDRLLDVGCGVGNVLNQAKQRGWDTYGTEFTDRAVEICRQNGHAMRKGPLDPSHYVPDSFDVIVYSEVIEHINNQLDEFRRVVTLLRPGGLLFVTTPNFDALSRRLLGGRWNIIQYPEHLVYLTPATLEDLMRRMGLETSWITTTGISISRLSASVSGEDVWKPAGSADEKARRALERPGARLLKRSLNWLLTITHLGDAMQAGFVKPEALLAPSAAPNCVGAEGP